MERGGTQLIINKVNIRNNLPFSLFFFSSPLLSLYSNMRFYYETKEIIYCSEICAISKKYLGIIFYLYNNRLGLLLDEEHNKIILKVQVENKTRLIYFYRVLLGKSSDLSSRLIFEENYVFPENFLGTIHTGSLFINRGYSGLIDKLEVFKEIREEHKLVEGEIDVKKI